MKLTKEQAKLHQQAQQLVDLDRDLTEDEKAFVLDHWQEGTTGVNALHGAFFTPAGLAQDFHLEVPGDRIIDLCAGIGRLAFHCRELFDRGWNGRPPREIVCVERNSAYITVGRKVLPEATWVQADVLDLPTNLGRFDCAISNPPFGAVKRTADGPGYHGRRFEYHVIAVASQIARHGAFIIPQASAPFRYSGQPCYREERDAECQRFERETGIRLEANCGIDTSIYAEDWHGVSPAVEIVTCDFSKVQQPRPAAVSVPERAVPVAAAPALPSPRPVRPIADAPLPVGQLDLFA